MRDRMIVALWAVVVAAGWCAATWLVYRLFGAVPAGIYGYGMLIALVGIYS